MDVDKGTWLERTEPIGGEPCLNFINSVSDRAGPAPIERLCSYPDLLLWLRRCGLLPADEAARLLALSRRKAEPAAAALKHALRFRDAAWRLLWARAHGETPAEGELVEAERYLKRFRNRTALLPAPEGFRLAWQGDEDDPEGAMWRTANALEKFLTSGELPRLRACAGETCGWLFVDRSRNGLRRWCSMRDCGNRAKARRHYRRVSRA